MIKEGRITFEPVGMTRTLQVADVLVDGKHIGLSERTYTPWMKPMTVVYWPHVESLSKKEATEIMGKIGGCSVMEEPYGTGYFVEFDDLDKAIEYCLKRG